MHRPRVSYDRDVDALYVKLADAPFARVEQLDDARLVNLAADGTVIGVEVLGVSEGVELEGMPHAEEIGRVLRRRGIPVRRPGGAARSPIAQAVATAVIGYRAGRGVSQAVLGEQLGMKPSQVARLELAEHDPSLETLQRLARVLGLRFVVDVAPASRSAEVTVPPGLKAIEDVTSEDGGRVLVAAG